MVGHLLLDYLRVVEFSLPIPVLVEQRSKFHVLLRLFIHLVEIKLSLVAGYRVVVIGGVLHFDPDYAAPAAA